VKHNYYYLVAGLRQIDLDADPKGFDAPALRREIAEGLTEADRANLREFYTLYDVANLIALREGRGGFSALGNLTRQELEDEIARPGHLLPAPLADVVRAYNHRVREDKSQDIDETIDTDQPFEKALWARFYAMCDRSSSAFVRRWYAFDRQLRNIAAAWMARRNGWPVAPQLVGEGAINEALARNTAADFGLRAEVDYIERLLAILDNRDIVEKERALDRLRWDVADGLTEFDYFDLDKILAWCVGIDIVHRWMTLDAQVGRELFRRLVDELTVRPVAI